MFPSSACGMSGQMLLDQNLIEKYLTKLDEITSPEYIDNVMKIIKLQVDGIHEYFTFGLSTI